MEHKRLVKKLRGYQKANRYRIMLLVTKTLNQEEFILYEIAIAITDWDRRHLETYGLFKATNSELAYLCGWDSDSTVSRHKKSLLEKGIFLDASNGYLRVKDFEDWQLRKTYPAENQDLPAETLTSPADIHDSSAEMHEIPSQQDRYSLVSSKDNLGLSDEDMELINESLRETEEQEH